MTEAKRLTEGVRSFEAGGVKFIINEHLTVDGFQRLEELRIEVESGNTAAGILSGIGQAVRALQKNDVYTASVCLYNATNAAERIAGKKYPPHLLALTLFVRPEGSDLSQWTETEAAAWIDAWNEEGCSVSDLFTLAFTTLRAFDTGFLPNFPDISAPQNHDAGAKETVKANGQKQP